jgi:uncharacterized membrane protein YeaQ/YmgE (transglycosylase-associated protein family)
MLQRNKYFGERLVPLDCRHPAEDLWFTGCGALRARGRRGLSRELGAIGGNIMEPQSIIVWLIVGAVAGWLAGMVVKGGGFGLIGDIVVGIIGAVIAGWLLPYLGINIGSGIVAAIIDAFVGAVVLLVILRLIKRV